MTYLEKMHLLQSSKVSWSFESQVLPLLVQAICYSDKKEVAFSTSKNDLIFGSSSTRAQFEPIVLKVFFFFGRLFSMILRPVLRHHFQPIVRG